jgi:hypothetical protein
LNYILEAHTLRKAFMDGYPERMVCMVIKGMRVVDVLPLTPENMQKAHGQANVRVDNHNIYICAPTEEGRNDSVCLDSQEGCYDDKYDAMVEGSGQA